MKKNVFRQMYATDGEVTVMKEVVKEEPKEEIKEEKPKKRGRKAKND